MSKYLTHKFTGIIVPIDQLTQGVDEALLCIADGAEDWFIYKDNQYTLHYDHSFENLGAYIKTKKNIFTRDTTYLHQLDQETLNKLVII